MKKKNRGFTLVEVLLCVGIIGIIAAITIPALLSSTSEKALEAQRKALHSRMAQAFGQIKNLKLYEQTSVNGTGDTIDNGSALNLITNGLSKVYKLASVCDAKSLRQCGIPDSVKDYYSETGSTSFDISDKKTLAELNDGISIDNDLGGLGVEYAAFKTANGESVLLWYNPRCKSKSEVSPHKLIESVCVNMIYDLNGKNNVPNTYGEDIGYITVFYPSDSNVVAPIIYNEATYEGTYSQMLSKATELALAPPTIEELTSILINKNLTNITKTETNISNLHWSSTYAMDNSGYLWAAGLSSGVQKKEPDALLPYYLIKK